MRIRVGHLYPGYLNIYADRGNIAVLAGPSPPTGARAGRSATIEHARTRVPDTGEVNLFYVGAARCEQHS